MAGPSWLAWAFASVVIIMAGYCLTRLVVSWRQHRPSDHRVDAIHVLMGVAMAGMLVPRLAVFWVGGWEVVFGMGAAWFGWLAIREFRGRPTVGGRPGHHLQHVLACGAMLYMFLAAATVAKAARRGAGDGRDGGRRRALPHACPRPGPGAVRIRGLDGGPTSSLAPVAALAARSAPVPVLAGAGTGGGSSMVAANGEGDLARPGNDARAPADPGRGRRCPPDWPRAARSAMGVTMGYMLILML